MRSATSTLASASLVVAEIGNNHEGDADVARELVERAADAGADAVKLQTFEPERFVRPREPERACSSSRGFQLPRGRGHERSPSWRASSGWPFISTPLDLGALELLEPLVDAYKIASGDNDFLPLLERVADTGQPIMISTGLAELPEIEAAVDVAEGALARARDRAGAGRPALRQRLPGQPPRQSNLAAIAALREALGCTVGYSDHTLGIEACVAAAALGARIIEKHFTLDHDFSDFRDHQLSADPGELRELVDRVADPPAAKALLGAGRSRARPGARGGAEPGRAAALDRRRRATCRPAT